LFFFVLTNCFGQEPDLNRIRNEYLNKNYQEVIKICSDEINKVDANDTILKSLIQYRVGSYMALSNFKSAIKDYKQLINIDKNEVSNFNGILYAYWAIGDTVNGLSSLEDAYRI